jgi:hypothetical protein
MGTLAKLVCLGFGAIYVFGLLLFLLAPTVRKRLRAALSNRERDKANSE